MVRGSMVFLWKSFWWGYLSFSLTNCGIRVKKRTGVLVGRSYQGLMGGLSLNIEMHEGWGDSWPIGRRWWGSVSSLQLTWVSTVSGGWMPSDDHRVGEGETWRETEEEGRAAPRRGSVSVLILHEAEACGHERRAFTVTRSSSQGKTRTQLDDPGKWQRNYVGYVYESIYT